MPFKDLLKKKEKLAQPAEPSEPVSPPLPHASEFRFVRTDTNAEEEIEPPTFDEEESSPSTNPIPPKRGFGRFRKSSTASPESSPSRKEHRKLSEKLRIGSTSKSRSSSASSAHVPSDLPDISDAYKDDGDQQEKEAQWEQRATILAKENVSPEYAKGSGRSPVQLPTEALEAMTITSGDNDGQGPPTGRPRSVSDAAGDVDIQEAIRLHEVGELPQATAMFHTLADQGNVLSQVLYGLSLRHAWGCEKNETLAIKYLSEAASNSANIESEALRSGLKKGGAAKGELVLAIFELGNCFRYGWGVSVDKVAARQYYETAANLGDNDAMNEAAWCYLEGFGGKKDKVSVRLHSPLLLRVSGGVLLSVPGT